MRSFLKRTAILTNVICAMASLGSAQSASFNQGSATPFSMLQSVNRPARLASLSNASSIPGLPSGINVPSTAVSALNVQTMGSWGICVASCANMPAPKTYYMHQKVSSASRNSDGKGATMYEGGTSFGGVMWNNRLGSTTATHFVMDFYIKIDHPENAQALEFAILKMDGSKWFKFSTQCNYASGALRGFNTKLKTWVNLGANCVKAQPNTWQRVTMQYSIVGGTVNFEAASFDGSVQPLSVSLPPQPKDYSSESMGMHFQLDNARPTTGYTVAIDNWNIYSW
jgi:hypothetical protein